MRRGQEHRHFQMSKAIFADMNTGSTVGHRERLGLPAGEAMGSLEQQLARGAPLSSRSGRRARTAAIASHVWSWRWGRTRGAS
jgi:hypothetical protein